MKPRLIINMQTTWINFSPTPPSQPLCWNYKIQIRQNFNIANIKLCSFIFSVWGNLWQEWTPEDLVSSAPVALLVVVALMAFLLGPLKSPFAAFLRLAILLSSPFIWIFTYLSHYTHRFTVPSPRCTAWRLSHSSQNWTESFLDPQLLDSSCAETQHDVGNTELYC